jgi:hypothetical protein
MLSLSHVFLFLVTVFSFLSTVSSLSVLHSLSVARARLPYLACLYRSAPPIRIAGSLLLGRVSFFCFFAFFACARFVGGGTFVLRLFEATVFSIQTSESRA